MTFASGCIIIWITILPRPDCRFNSILRGLITGVHGKRQPQLTCRISTVLWEWCSLFLYILQAPQMLCSANYSCHFAQKLLQSFGLPIRQILYKQDKTSPSSNLIVVLAVFSWNNPWLTKQWTSSPSLNIVSDFVVHKFNTIIFHSWEVWSCALTKSKCPINYSL